MSENIFINIPPEGSESWRSPVPTAADLPASGNTIGDVIVTQDTLDVYGWNGTMWVLIAGPSGAMGIISLNGQTGSSQTFATSESGTNFTITSAGNVHTFNLPVASSTNTGKLSNTDWTTFNNKQASGSYITALTGDVTASGPGSSVATLATVNSNVGSFGSSTSIPNFTVNGKGLITAAGSNVVIAPAGTLTGITLASNVVSSSLTSVGTISSGVWNGSTIAIAYGGTNSSTALNNNRVMESIGGAIVEAAAITANQALISDSNGLPIASVTTATELSYVSGVTSSIQTQLNSKSSSTLTSAHLFVGNASNVATDTAVSGDLTLANTGAFTLNTVNSNVGSFGSSTSIPSFTVNGKGLITAASGNAVIAPAGTLSGTTLNSTVVTSSLTSLGTQAQALNMGNNLINNVSPGISGTDAINLNQLQNALSGTQWRPEVNLFDNVDTTLPATTATLIDGVTVTNGMRVLFVNLALNNNEVYNAAVSGSSIVWTAALDNDRISAAPVTGDSILVLSGTTYSESAWNYNGTAFVQFNGAGQIQPGNALSKTGNTLNVQYDNSTIGLNGSNQLYIPNGGIANAQISSSAAISFSKLASLTSANILVGNGSNVAASVSASGDLTLSNTGAFTLATVNTNTGSFGSSTAIPNFTVNGKGLITAAGTNVVIAPAGTLSGTTLNSTVVSSSLTSVGTIATGVWNGTTIAIANGGTGQTSASAAFNALNPMTTTGDLIYESGTNTASRLAIGSSGNILTVSGGVPVWSSPVASSLTSAHLFVGNASNVATDTAVSGDLTLANTGAFTIATGAVTDTKGSLSVKPAVTVVAVAQTTLLGNQTIDGVTTINGSLVLCTAQSTPSQNGPWVANSGSWIRPTWYPSGGTTQAFQFITIFVRSGTTYSGSTWTMTTSGAITIDTTSTTWTESTYSLNTNTVTGTLPVANGGTGLASGTSGGILGFTASGTLASSGALTANQLIIGGGAGVTPSTLSAGSQYQVLTMGASNPGYGAVNLGQSAAITGTLPIGNGGTGQTTANAAFNALSPMTTGGDIIYGGASGAATRLANGTNGQVLTSSGGTSAPTWTTVSGGGGAMVQISKVVTASSASSVTFSTISGSYNNLRLVIQARSNASQITDGLAMQFNSDGGNNYQYTYISGLSSGTSSVTAASATFEILCGRIPGATSTANYAGAVTIDIPNYSATTFYKSIVAQSSACGGSTQEINNFEGAWANTAAITNIQLYPGSSNTFKDGTTFILYGIT